MERITVNLTPGGALGICHASQYDLGREIAYDLMDGDSVYTLDGTETVTIVIKRPDGVTVERAISNTSDSYVIWTSDEGDCDAAGVAECELRFAKGSQDLGSGNFLMLVEADPFNGAGVHVVTVGPADICTFETTLPEPLQSVTVDIVATGGNGTPDNPVPINGYSSANITRCGVNLWDEEWEVGSIDPSTGATFNDPARIRSKNYSPIKGGIEIYTIDPTNNYNIRLFYYDVNKNYIGASIWLGNQTSTIPNGACYFKFIMGGSYGTTYNNDISILYPSSEHNYHAYNGQTYTIAFGQTVYGGVLDVTRGKLTVDKAYKDLGTLDYTMYSVAQGNLFRSDEFDIKRVTSTIEVPDIISSAFVAAASANRTNYTISMTNNTARIDVIDDDYSDAVAFKTAMSGVQIVYPLATPFDIDLTPEVISAIVGVNNVFADCGQSTVKYLKAGA